MLSYIVQRIVYMAVLLLLLSFVSFVLIELPPGDFLDNLISSSATPACRSTWSRSGVWRSGMA